MAENVSSERPEGRRLIVWGAGGHGKVVAEVACLAGWTVVGFADADLAKRGQIAEPRGARVILDEAGLFGCLDVASRAFDAVAIALGVNEARHAAWRALTGRIALPVLVHPDSTLSQSAKLGEGSVVMARAVINPAAELGAVVIVNSAAVVEHDCVVGDAVHLSPNCTLAGGVRVGNLAWIGAGATVIQSCEVGRASIVGAGSVVVRNVPPDVTVVGCPARISSQRR